jgi:hypothetical protein
MNYQEKLNSLTSNSVWVFTKQSVDFDNAFNATKLFAQMPENENIEAFFARHYREFGINTDRHRVLVISQLYGLLTKTPFYKKDVQYKSERTTQVFDELCLTKFGSDEYNTIKTEQMLKIKIRAIIDTVDNNQEYNVLPFIFIYRVLHDLKEQHGLEKVDISSLYTYIMTCSDYSQYHDAVRFISQNSPTASNELTKKYADLSRITALLKKLNLFIIDKQSIAINEKYDVYFKNEFMDKYDIDELNAQLKNEIDYTYFLTTLQNFKIDLIGEPKHYIGKKAIIHKRNITESSDDEYIDKVNQTRINNINVAIVDNAAKRPPAVATHNVAEKFSRNPAIGRIALNLATYKCAIDETHQTFISATSNQPYMEPHHIVPISKFSDIWGKYKTNVDCIENIASLCPICHRAIHYANRDLRTKLITMLYKTRVEQFKNIGLNISLDDLLAMYFIP